MEIRVPRLTGRLIKIIAQSGTPNLFGWNNQNNQNNQIYLVSR